ncbi:MAG: 30S ribosomal protein S20 [Saccharofermentans sp.]|nr:30S ribosomal protein S20 [Saccharofermentans sp.]
MPNIKSAIKRVSVSEKKAAANKSKKTAIRTTVKKAKANVAAGENVEATLKATQKAVDQAAAKGHMSKNAASRTKSRLAKAAKADK